MKIKTINFITLGFLSIICSLQGIVQINEFNPADYGDRVNWQLGLPVLNLNIDAGNSLINLTQLELIDQDRYDNGHVMTDSEKKLLSKDDLIVNSGVKVNALEIGFRNFNFSLDGFGYLHSKVLDKQYAELALYGNETNQEYVFNAGAGSRAYSFIKASLSYSHSSPLKLGMIFSRNEDKESLWNEILDYPIYAGVNLNIYRSLLFFKMEESTQSFGSMNDSLFYNYYSKYYFSDEESKGKLSLGLGLGIKFLLPEGEVHLSLDDLFTKLHFENVAGGEFEGTYVDYLLYFHNDDYDPLDENYENDSLRVKKKSVSFDPTFRFLAYHQVYKKLDLIMKYKSSSYEYPQGLAAGLNFTPVEFLPLQVMIGYDDNMYYGLNAGLHFKNIEYTIGMTFYHGFFNHARGLGFTNLLKIKF